MQAFYPIQVIDLIFQIDYVTPKKISLIENMKLLLDILGYISY